MNTVKIAIGGMLVAAAAAAIGACDKSSDPESPTAMQSIRYSTAHVGGVGVSYREAGDPSAPTIVLLHGFPSSSHEFRMLIPALADRFHLIAPDYPGFGYSDAPAPPSYGYTFDHLADSIDGLLAQLGVGRFALYVQDYGAPVGYRLATRHPDAITAIIVQNGIAYTDGLSSALAPLEAYWKDRSANETAVRNFLTPETTKFQYVQGSPDTSKLSPDAWTLDQALLDRAGNDQIQLDLLFDYQNNVPKFADWQAYFRATQPPMLIAWGENDPFFTPDAAKAYLRDLPAAELHLLDAGHFALEDHNDDIAALIRAFADRTPGLAR
jgi:pimeloyl-ACP methyl ester carboxylesterase